VKPSPRMWVLAAGSCAFLSLVPGRGGAALAQERAAWAAQERHIVEQAEGLERAGRWEEAMALLENWLEESPASVSALALLARLAERHGEPARVLPLAERALERDRTELPAARQVWIRALAAAGDVDSARSAAERWVAARPQQPAAYTELAALRLQQGDQEGAIAVLLAGREAVASDRAFVQELALLCTESGRYADAAAEWQIMLRWGDAGVEAVRRHVSDVAPSRDGALAALRTGLGGADPGGGVADGALRLALHLGEFEWARELLAARLRGLSDPAARALLESYVERSRAAGDLRGAAWGAAELARRVADDRQAEYWRIVGAELLLDAGDRQSAARAFDDLLGRAVEGGDAHRLAVRRLQELTMAEDPRRAAELLEEYTSRYPEDPAVESMSLAMAEAWMSRGEPGPARRLLDSPPVAAGRFPGRRSELLGRADLLEGDLDGARRRLEEAVVAPELDGAQRTRAARWLSLLERETPDRLVPLAAAVRDAVRGDPRGIMSLVGAWASVDAAALCAAAAQELEDAGFPAEAGTVRRRIVEHWPSSAEAPAALLSLARDAAGTHPEAALRWLERLIVEHPESALAPTARREAARLGSQVPGL